MISYEIRQNHHSRLLSKTSTAIKKTSISTHQKVGRNSSCTEKRRHHHIEAQVKLVSVQQQGPFLKSKLKKPNFIRGNLYIPGYLGGIYRYIYIMKKTSGLIPNVLGGH